VLAQWAGRFARHAADHVVVGRNHDLGVGADDGARELDEADDHLLIGEDEAGLLVAVARVVHARPEDLARIRKRSEETVDRDRLGALDGSGSCLESALAVADQRQRVGVPGRMDLPAGLDAAAEGAPALVLDDAHACSFLAW
jgi:hypothetical protein